MVKLSEESSVSVNGSIMKETSRILEHNDILTLVERSFRYEYTPEMLARVQIACNGNNSSPSGTISLSMETPKKPSSLSASVFSISELPSSPATPKTPSLVSRASSASNGQSPIVSGISAASFVDNEITTSPKLSPKVFKMDADLLIGSVPPFNIVGASSLGMSVVSSTDHKEFEFDKDNIIVEENVNANLVTYKSGPKKEDANIDTFESVPVEAKEEVVDVDAVFESVEPVEEVVNNAVEIVEEDNTVIERVEEVANTVVIEPLEATEVVFDDAITGSNEKTTEIENRLVATSADVAPESEYFKAAFTFTLSEELPSAEMSELSALNESIIQGDQKEINVETVSEDVAVNEAICDETAESSSMVVEDVVMEEASKSEIVFEHVVTNEATHEVASESFDNILTESAGEIVAESVSAHEAVESIQQGDDSMEAEVICDENVPVDANMECETTETVVEEGVLDDSQIAEMDCKETIEGVEGVEAVQALPEVAREAVNVSVEVIQCVQDTEMILESADCETKESVIETFAGTDDTVIESKSEYESESEFGVLAESSVIEAKCIEPVVEAPVESELMSTEITADNELIENINVVVVGEFSSMSSSEFVSEEIIEQQKGESAEIIEEIKNTSRTVAESIEESLESTNGHEVVEPSIELGSEAICSTEATENTRVENEDYAVPVVELEREELHEQEEEEDKNEFEIIVEADGANEEIASVEIESSAGTESKPASPKRPADYEDMRPSTPLRKSTRVHVTPSALESVVKNQKSPQSVSKRGLRSTGGRLTRSRVIEESTVAPSASPKSRSQKRKQHSEEQSESENDSMLVSSLSDNNAANDKKIKTEISNPTRRSTRFRVIPK